MARGLLDKWKQPVYIGFDEQMTKKLIPDIVSKLHEIHFDVVACVSDCGGGNQGLWKKLKISVENNFMPHPVTGEKICIFAGVPRRLNLLRNWFVDKGFILIDGIINKHHLECVIDDSNTEISSCHKLSKLHLTCVKVQRQNVKLTAQFFSRTTAVALRTYLPGSNPNLAKRTSDFFLTNKWFELMNSFTLSASVPTKKPFWVLLESQTSKLNKMMKEFENLKCSLKQKQLQVFQKGINISTKSTPNLYEDMKRKTQNNLHCNPPPK